MTETSYHMPPDKFRKHADEVIEWLVSYHKRIDSLPVLSRVKPNEIRASLPAHPPQKGERFEQVLKDFDTIILPGLTHWQSPNFFAYFPSNVSGPSILGELLSAGIGVQGMLWITSPACTELETHMLDWFVEMLALPDSFKSNGAGGGVIQDSASSATLCALIAAREHATNFESNESGCNGKLIAYASTQAHSSVEKAVKIAGIGRRNLRLIEVDNTSAMNPEALKTQIKEDRQRGLIPFFICATIGTTSSNAMDPLPKIGKISREEGLWLHVDAAMSGNAAICPEFRKYQDGLELADSYCFNPHKWLFTNFDCSCFYVADRKALTESLSLMPEYLKNAPSASGDVIDYRDWQIPLGRRFRALKLWLVIRHYGIEGLQFYLRKHIDLAQQFASWVEQSESFELSAPVPLNLVCFRHKKGDEATKRLHEELNKSGQIYLTHTTLNSKYTLRFCIGQATTELHHVESAWKLIQKTGEQLE